MPTFIAHGPRKLWGQSFGASTVHSNSSCSAGRIAAKDLDRKLAVARTLTQKRLLRSEADEAWGKAYELSEATGRAFYDREGDRVNASDDKTNMVTVVITAYAEKRGLQYVFDD